MFQEDGNYPVRHRRCSHLSNPPFTRRSFPSGIRDGGRRELREPRPCSLGARNVCRDLAAVGIPPQVQESPVRVSNEGALGCSASPIGQDSAQVFLIQRNHKIQTLPAYASHQSFAVGVRLWRSHGRVKRPHSKSLEQLVHLCRKDRVTVTDQETVGMNRRVSQSCIGR